MSLLQNPCSVCGLAILSGDSFIGTGDGQMTNGGSFAHDVCYYRDQANHLQKLCEEQRDTLDSIKEAIGGASSHPETGVSIVDDVRDLKAKVEEQRVELEVERGISMSKNTELLEMSRKIEEQNGEIAKVKALLYEVYGSALEREGRMTKRVCLVEGFDWNAWFKKAEEIEYD